METLLVNPEIKEKEQSNSSTQYSNKTIKESSKSKKEGEGKGFKNIKSVLLSYNVSGEKPKSKPAVYSTYLDYEFNGERFELHQKNGMIYLNHPKWSLVGMGKTLLDAEIDMINDAKIIAEEYIGTNDTNLSDEAQKLKNFLFNII